MDQIRSGGATKKSSRGSCGENPYILGWGRSTQCAVDVCETDSSWVCGSVSMVFVCVTSSECRCHLGNNASGTTATNILGFVWQWDSHRSSDLDNTDAGLVRFFFKFWCQYQLETGATPRQVPPNYFTISIAMWRKMVDWRLFVCAFCFDLWTGTCYSHCFTILNIAIKIQCEHTSRYKYVYPIKWHVIHANVRVPIHQWNAHAFICGQWWILDLDLR